MAQDAQSSSGLQPTHISSQTVLGQEDVKQRGEAQETGNPKRVAVQAGGGNAGMSSAELAHAELELIKRNQGRYLSKVLHDSCKSIQNSNPLAQYHPFIDTEGLLRCR